MRNLFQYVGLRHLRMKPARSILTTLGVSLGVALFIGIEIINQSTLGSFKESIDAIAGKATLTVSLGETGFPEEKLDVISHVPGVKQAVPMIEARAYFAGKQANETLMVMGVDLLKETGVRTYKTTDEQVIDDPLTFLNQPDSIIVTHAFAEEHHLKIDDKFTLGTAHGPVSFTVRGLLSPEGPAKAYGGSMAIMDIDGARVSFGKEGKLDRVDIVTRPSEDVEKVAERVRTALGPGYQVDRPETQNENMERMVKSFQTMLTFFSTLALLVGLFLVSNSISISVAERKREIGTLRALGATRRGILALFLSEAAAIGAVGAFAGAWMGRGLASLLVGMIARSMSSQYLTKFDVARLVFGPHEVIRAIWIGAAAALVAAAFPAFKATQIQPLEAMRQREVGEDAASRGMYRLLPWIGLALLAYVVLGTLLFGGPRTLLMDTIGNASAMIGSALVGPTVVAALVRMYKKVSYRLTGTIGRLATDNLLRNPKRTGSNVMSLMVGLILVIMIAIVNVSFRQTVLDWFDKILQADLLVSSNGRIISYQIQPLHEELAEMLKEIPGVLVEPAPGAPGGTRGAFGLRYIHVKYEGRTLGLKAYDEPDPEIHYSSLDVQDRPVEQAGRELFHSEEPVAMVSENFVLHFNRKTGDHVELATPSGPVSFRIVGVVNDYASPEGIFYLNRAQYKKYWRDPLVSLFALRVRPGVDPMKVRAEIDSRYGQSKNLTVVSNADIRNQMTATVDQSFAYTRAIELAALLVGLLGLLNTLLISVMERTRELGMLRAVGMARGQLSWMILQEALIQGSFGAIAAVALGSGIAWLWITHSLARVLGWMIQFHFPWTSVLSTVLIGTFVAWLAGLYPSRRAANIAITEALEYE